MTLTINSGFMCLYNFIKNKIYIFFITLIFANFNIFAFTIFKDDKSILNHNSNFHSTSKSNYTKDVKTHLPILLDGSLLLPSNANNFNGRWNAHVNSRTGSVSFSVRLATFVYNNGQNTRPLSLTWNSSPVPSGANYFNLQANWRWNIAIEKSSTSLIAGHLTDDIITSDGNHFTMISTKDNNGKTIWKPLRHKLHDVKITGKPGDWDIKLSTGKHEHITNGYEDWEEEIGGIKIWLIYDHKCKKKQSCHFLGFSTEPALEYEHKSLQNNLRISYSTNNIKITNNSHNTILHYANNHLTHINFPSLSSPKTGAPTTNAMLNFTWDDSGNLPWLLHKIQYPDGSKTTFFYNQESNDISSIKGLAVGWYGANLPVVTKMLIESGRAEIPNKIFRYFYGDNSKDQHNFTGYQSNKTLIPGIDNLLDRDDIYTYKTTEDNGVTKKTTTYNKYHLPLFIEIKDKNNNLITKTDMQYLPWKRTHFSQLQPVWSKPLKKNKLFYSLIKENNHIFKKQKRLLEENKYDDLGRTIWQKDAIGRMIFTKYCPVTGNTHCPVFNAKWPQLNHPMQVLIVPSSKEDPNAKAKEIIIDYTALNSSTDNINSKSYKFDNNQTSNIYWQTKRKTIYEIPIKNLPNLNKDSVLIAPDSLHKKSVTEYFYDTKINSPFYGQLSIIKNYQVHHHSNTNKFYNFNNDEDLPVTIAVQHILNKANNTRTMVTTAISANKTALNKTFASSNDLSLGKAVYSINKGVKLLSTDALKNIQTEWFYDDWNRPIKKVVTPNDNNKPLTTYWSYIVTDSEQSIITTSPNGNQTKKVIGPNGELLSMWHRFSFSKNKPMIGYNHWIPDSSMSYNSQGKLITKTNWIESDAKNLKDRTQLKQITHYGYDILNRPVWIQKPDKTVHIIVYDDINLRQIEYNMAPLNDSKKITLGPLIKVTKSNLQGKPIAVYLLKTQIKSNNLSLLTIQKHLNSLFDFLKTNKIINDFNNFNLLPVGGANGLLTFVNSVIKSKNWQNVTYFEYDDYGHLLKKELGNGTTTKWQWEQDHPIATIFNDGRIIRDKFDIQGHVIKRCLQPANSSECHILGKNVYDTTGNLIWKSDQENRITKYEYDLNGRKTAMLTADGHTFTWKYNAIGLTEQRIDGKLKIKYSYNPATWELTDTEDSISHIHYEYYKNTHFLKSIKQSKPKNWELISYNTNYPEGTKHYYYDHYGITCLYLDIHGNKYWNIHDNLGRIIKTLVKLNGHSKSSLLTEKKYDNFGRIHTIKNGLGIESVYYYGDQGTVNEILNHINNKTIEHSYYNYDPITGSLVKFIQNRPGIKTTYNYSYDNNNNLTEMHCNDKSTSKKSLCPRDTTYTTNTTKSTPIIHAQYYTFDKWNNINKVTENLEVDEKKITKINSYFYMDEKNKSSNINSSYKNYDPFKLIAISEHLSNQNYNPKPLYLSYDKMGRMIKDTQGNTIHYNAQGLQDKFTNGKTHEYVIYLYNHSGKQVVKSLYSKNGISLQAPFYMLYNGYKISSKVQDDITGKQHIIVELGGVAQSNNGNISNWYMHNKKNDIIKVYNNKGIEQNDYVYSPYGMQYDLKNHSLNIVSSFLRFSNLTPQWQNSLPGFNGEFSDSVTGYQFLGGGYRAYNPVYRRFMARDSYSPFKVINGFAFGNNNPIMNNDPSGHTPNWFGYLAGAATITSSIAMGLLLPVAMAGVSAIGILTCIGTSSANNAVLIGISAINAVLGVTTGSLQIAYTKKSNFDINRAGSLAFAKNIMDILHDITGVVQAMSFSVIGILAARVNFASLECIGGSLGSTYNKIDIVALTASGISNTIGQGLGIVESSMLINSKSSSNKYNNTAKNFGYASTGFEIASMGMALIPSAIRSIKFAGNSLFKKINLQIARIRRSILANNQGYESFDMQEYAQLPSSQNSTAETNPLRITLSRAYDSTHQETLFTLPAADSNLGESIVPDVPKTFNTLFLNRPEDVKDKLPVIDVWLGNLLSVKV